MENTPDVNVTSKKYGFNIGYVVIALVILLVLAGGSYLFFVNKPINIYKKLINHSYASVSNELKEIDRFNFFNKEISAKFDISVDSNIEELEDYVGDTYSINTNMDYKNKYAGAEFKLANGKDKMDFKAILDDENIYLIAPKYLKNVMNVSENSDIDWSALEDINVDMDDIDTILKGLKNEVISSLDKDNFEKEKDSLIINDKERKVSKISYSLKGSEANETFGNIVDGLKDNDDFIKAIANIANMDKSDIKDFLNEAKDNFDIGDTKLEFNVYVKGITKKIVQVEMVINDDSITYKNYNDEDIAVIIEIDGEEATLNIQKDKDTYEVEFEVEELKITATVNTYTDKEIDLDYTIKYDKDILASGSFTGKIDDNKKDHIKTENELVVKIAGDKDQMIKLNVDYEITANDIDKENTKNASSFDKLTEEEQEKLLDDLLTDIKKFNIYNYYLELEDSFTAKPIYEFDNDNDYDYDFDYDFSEVSTSNY